MTYSPIRAVSIAVLFFLLMGCSAIPWANQTREDTGYLTPASEQTLAAFRADSPIHDKTQAVIAAQAILSSTRLRPKQMPRVASVQELALAEAQRRVAQAGVSSYDDRPSDTLVWLVIFQGEWQVFPPDPLHTITPPPASVGCVYVLMDAKDPGRSQVGSIECIHAQSTTPTPTPVPTTTLLTLSPADRIAIYSTVAHYHFDPSNKILGDQRRPVIFVSPNLATNLDPAAQHWDGDPTPPELLPQLHDLAPRVELATLQAVIQRDRMNAVREDGIWLGFGSIQVKESEVQVEVESFINGINAVGYAYRLVRQGDRWVVLQASLRWIS